MRHVRKAASDIGNFSSYFRVWCKQSEPFHSRFRLYIEILLLALDKFPKMIFVKSIFALLTTDFLLTGKSFRMLGTFNGGYHTNLIAIPSNARISLLFRF